MTVRLVDLPPHEFAHASAILMGSRAVLLRGPSGSGKSSLSQMLVEFATQRSRFARLISDDQVRMSAHNGRLVLEPPASIAGLIEHAGIGVFETPFEKCAVAGLVVDLAEFGRSIERLPEQRDLKTNILGIELARIELAFGAPGNCNAISNIMALLAASGFAPNTLAEARIENLLHVHAQLSNDARQA